MKLRVGQIKKKKNACYHSLTIFVSSYASCEQFMIKMRPVYMFGYGI